MREQENLFEKAEAALKHSWEVHRQAFGPILEPAFADNPQARITLIAALNHISRREVKQGMELLKQLKDACVCDDDRAAWTFFVGVCFEMGGAKEQSLRWYADTGKYHHRFHFPYLKLAKAAHNEARYEHACEYYHSAIDCLLEASEKDRDDEVLASAYTNLTACLTLMHRLPEARAAWEKASRLPVQPAAAGTAAILYAALGDRTQCAHYVAKLNSLPRAILDSVTHSTEQILRGTHPHFNRVPVDPQAIRIFWGWFATNERALAQQEVSALSALSKALKLVFPFLDRTARVQISRSGSVSQAVFSDFYGIGLHYGYGALLEDCPQELRSRWVFSIIH